MILEVPVNEWILGIVCILALIGGVSIFAYRIDNHYKRQRMYKDMSKKTRSDIGSIYIKENSKTKKGRDNLLNNRKKKK